MLLNIKVQGVVLELGRAVLLYVRLRDQESDVWYWAGNWLAMY